MKHKLHPDYLAAFRGGSHPLHPASRAFHAQYVAVEHLADPDKGELYDAGVVSGGPDGGEVVFTFAGASLWYRRDDFVRLCRGAKDVRYRAIADEFEQEAM